MSTKAIKPKTGVLMFTIDIRDKIRTDHPEWSSSLIIKEVYRQWNTLTLEEKMMYNDRAKMQNEAPKSFSETRQIVRDIKTLIDSHAALEKENQRLRERVRDLEEKLNETLEK